MTRSLHFIVCGAVCVSWLGMNTALGQNPYRWNRTAQTLGAAANVTVTAQGETVDDDQPRTTTTQDSLVWGAEREITRTAFAGSGGGGGDSGSMWPAVLSGDDGEHGANAPPADGLDGLPGDAYSGQGGKSGGNGFARAWGQTHTNDALNINGQAALSYS